MKKTNKIALSVNLNKVALVRNSRDGNYPDLKHFAKICLDAGAQGLTVHPRPDQRHIRPSDIDTLSHICQQYNAELNIEGNPFETPRDNYPGLLALAEKARPAQCTLVPDSSSQKTSDHGFDLKKDFDALHPIIQQLKSRNIRVSLFMDPDIEQIALAHKVGADRIELYTGPFAEAFNQGKAEAVFQQHCNAAVEANRLGLSVNAGHDLNLQNMVLYKALPELQEVSIGHALTVDALMIGFEQAVQEYLNVCS